jgi:hypothetical protein
VNGPGTFNHTGEAEYITSRTGIVPSNAKYFLILFTPAARNSRKSAIPPR